MKHLTLHNYIPESSISLVEALLDKQHFYLKIKNKRKTKHGDFRPLKNGDYQITINNDLNKFRFLITLVHEIAHLKTFKEYKRIKPHGIEWKINFQHLMLPFLKLEIFPTEILSILANYLRNPKASTDSDIKLSLVLKLYDKKSNQNYIFEIPLKSKFKYNNRIFEKGEKRRVRYKCIEVTSKKVYLFHPNAEVKVIN
ncbi:MAG: sprT domain-containing protein [Flavobacteriaceae bacterium]|nr:sprT domain-containing protein [Flavobacteriaceae bacterium]